MQLCGMKSKDDTPEALCQSNKGAFLRKLAAKVVDFVFIKPENLDVLLRTTGASPSQDPLCLCNGGTDGVAYVFPIVRWIHQLLPCNTRYNCTLLCSDCPFTSHFASHDA